MTAENTQADRDVIVVDTNHPSNWYDLHELWRYRELIWILAVRDVTVRYRQTVVGLAWTALQPVALMLALGLFTKMVSGASSSDQIPGEVKTLSGLVLYQLFAAIITVSTNCLVDNRQMLTKVYFPRVVLPLAACLRPLLDFSIGLVLLTLTMTWFRVTPAPTVVLSPVFVLLTVFTALGFGLWLSALNAHYRDFSHLVPFALQLGLIISPIATESARIPDAWRWLYFANPMAGMLDAFRWTILGTRFPAWNELAMSISIAVVLLISGGWYFRRVDRFLADSI